jgi:hypothetical protein
MLPRWYTVKQEKMETYIFCIRMRSPFRSTLVLTSLLVNWGEPGGASAAEPVEVLVFVPSMVESDGLTLVTWKLKKYAISDLYRHLSRSTLSMGEIIHSWQQGVHLNHFNKPIASIESFNLRWGSFAFFGVAVLVVSAHGGRFSTVSLSTTVSARKQIWNRRRHHDVNISKAIVYGFIIIKHFSTICFARSKLPVRQ